MDLEIEGLDELTQQLEKMGYDVKQNEEKALVAGAEVMQKATKGQVRVRTGNLKDHIEISDVENGEVYVYVDQQGQAYYGFFLEMGTSKMRAQPFMGPAFNRSKGQIERAMADSLRQVLGLM
ncbi:MAG TPA: HK97-gp10 family putative phage morphogenesis protein [Atopostipes sp.]|nr:HK97-gp10 family putative phage morphogenesis protein [Atopostipes sp.]